MSAWPLSRGELAPRIQPGAALNGGAIAGALLLGLALHSSLLLGLAAVAGAFFALRVAPELALVLLAGEGTLKNLSPFTEIPVDFLIVTLVLTAWACAVVVRRHGLPRLPWTTALVIVLSTLLVVAAMRSTLPGAAGKGVYFEIVVLTLFFSPFVLVRDLDALVRLALGFAVVGLIVAHAAAPSADPTQPYTLPGGSEIEAALYPAFGALALATCVALRVRGFWRLPLLALAVVLAAAAVRAGSRGVLVSLIGAGAFGCLLLIFHSRRPLLSFSLLAAAALAALEAGRQVADPAALSRYGRLTSDPRRGYLHARALDEALAHPFGNGIGTFGLNLPVLNPRPSVPYPHDVALEVFDEAGIFALAALVALVVAAFAAALRVARLPGAAFCAVGLAFALLEAFASGNVTADPLLWMTLGIALAMPGEPAR